MKKVIIVGGHEQACNILSYIIQNAIAEIVLCICRQDDTGEDGTFPSLLKKAREFDVPSLQPNNLNSSRVLDSVDRLNADLVLSLQNNMVFGESWVNLFDGKLGIANVHYAPLPRYAGYWPEMWAIWNSETEFAVTLHYVGVGIDAGAIIVQRDFIIDESGNRKSLYEKSSSECYTMLLEILPNLLERRLPAYEQDQSLRTYFSKSLPNDGFIDLNWDAETQQRFIRAIAFPGFPGPKIRIGKSTYTLVAEDLPFFRKIDVSYNQG
jgi:methionyl-tRNA formyltransferase